MNDEKISGNIDQAKGKVKEEWGKVTDDKSTQAEGLLDQAKGKVKETVGDVKDSLNKDSGKL